LSFKVKLLRCELGGLPRPLFNVVVVVVVDLYYAVRRVKLDEHVLVRQRFADVLISNNNRDLWSLVRGQTNGLMGRKPCQKAYPNCFLRNITIFTVVYPMIRRIYKINDIINSRILKDGCSADCMVTADEVASVINKLKPNMQDGNEGLSNNHFRNARVQFHIHTSCLFSGMLVHDYIPNDFYGVPLFHS